MRWTNSDTAGFILAALILVTPPVAFMKFVDSLRKPQDPSTPLATYLTVIAMTTFAAIVSSAIGWRFGGSEYGRWAIHGLVAMLILSVSIFGWCFFTWG